MRQPQGPALAPLHRDDVDRQARRARLRADRPPLQGAAVLVPTDGHGAPPQRNRIHIDIYGPVDQAEAGIAAAGGHLVNDGKAPEWWTLADAEGIEVEVASGQTATDAILGSWPLDIMRRRMALLDGRDIRS
jgi:hypothetical protein